MKRLNYRDYTITPGAIYDESTGKYAPTVISPGKGQMVRMIRIHSL